MKVRDSDRLYYGLLADSIIVHVCSNMQYFMQTTKTNAVYRRCGNVESMVVGYVANVCFVIEEKKLLWAYNNKPLQDTARGPK